MELVRESLPRIKILERRVDEKATGGNSRWPEGSTRRRSVAAAAAALLAPARLNPRERGRAERERER